MFLWLAARLPSTEKIVFGREEDGALAHLWYHAAANTDVVTGLRIDTPTFRVIPDFNIATDFAP